MLKHITILTIMILSLAVSNCFAQGLAVIIDKIKSVEDKLDQIDTKLNGEIEKLMNGTVTILAALICGLAVTKIF